MRSKQNQGKKRTCASNFNKHISYIITYDFILDLQEIERLKAVVEEKNRKIKELEELNTKKRKYVQSDSQKNWTAFEHWVNNYTRSQLFHKVKFISNKIILDSFEEEGTVGFEFLRHYQSTYLATTKQLKDEEKKKIWSDAKDRVSKSLNNKRSSFCTQVKKKFQSKLNALCL